MTKKEQQVQQNKKVVLEALEKSLGVVTDACRAVKIDRTTFYRYVKTDPEFAAKVKDISEVAIDFAESSLHKQIADGNATATIFFLKTKAKHRGYIERLEFQDVRDAELNRLKKLIENRANQSGRDYTTELRLFVDQFADDLGVPPQIKERLISELPQ